MTRSSGDSQARRPIDGTFSMAHENVAFETADGLTIRGWYAPSRNGPAVVFVHGSGGNRDGPRKQAQLLAAHGYGVLLYDSRGRGESDRDGFFDRLLLRR